MKQTIGSTRPPTDGEVPPLQRDILIALRRIIRAVDLYSRQLVEQHGLTGPQLATLQEIAKHGSLNPRSIARAVRISQATVTGILDRLERRNFVTRTRSGTDRRAVDVGLTPEGRQVLESAPPLLQEQFIRELGKLQTWEQTMMLATLQRVASMMDAEGLPAAPHLVSGPEQL